MATTSSLDMARSRFSPWNIGSLACFLEHLPPQPLFPNVRGMGLSALFSLRVEPTVTEASLRLLIKTSLCFLTFLLTAETPQNLKQFPTAWAVN